MSKHTPGRWEVRGSAPLTVGSGMHVICNLHAPASNTEALADARLIAAAPELLAALQNLIENGESAHAVRRDLAWTQARAAIAKATQ